VCGGTRNRTHGCILILSNSDIHKALTEGKISIEPSPPVEHFSTSAVDLRVGSEFRRWKQQARGVELSIDVSRVRLPELTEYTEPLAPDADGLVSIPKNELILTKTLEVIDLPVDSCIAARVEGRSSLARLGLSVHITAPIIHSGFYGPIVLEVLNQGGYNLKIRPNKACLCQLVFEQVSSPPTCSLETVFLGQETVLGGTKSSPGAN